MRKNEVFIVAGKRTPFCEWIDGKKGDGEPGGVLKNFTAVELGVLAARATLDSANVKPALIDQLVFGNAYQTSADALFGGRDVVLKLGLPVETPALTVNRICGSGLEVFRQAAFSILLEGANFVLAGGAENLSQTPYLIRNLRQYFGAKSYLALKKKLGRLPRYEDIFGALPGLKYVDIPIHDLFWEFLRHDYSGLMMPETAERLAKQYGITREEADAVALRSHLLAKAATKSGRLREEIVGMNSWAHFPYKEGRYAVVTQDGERVYDDDHFVPTCSSEGLAKLQPVFAKDGLVTAGNASGVVDGGAFCLLASKKALKKHNLKPLARILSWSAVGVQSDIMGIGPAPAVKKALSLARLKQSKIDLWEVNEAFACQYLAVEKALGLDREKVNVNGGAIGLGHPFAATGVRMLLALALELRHRQKRYGVATVCIGGGQGMAVVIESL